MMKRNNSKLFYTCSLIEFIGRQTKQERQNIICFLGRETIERIYEYADVFHCEPIAKVADDFIERAHIPNGDYDNVKSCRYNVPDYWTIGEVYERLIEDVGEEDTVIETLIEVYQSWISPILSNYNNVVYFQSREYIAVCYQEGKIL